MDDYRVALLLHLVGVLLFVAGIVLAGVAFEMARRQDSPAEIALLLGLTRVGVALVGVGSLLLGIFGLWLVHLGGFGYGAGWLDDSIALYVVALVLGACGGQRPNGLVASRRGCTPSTLRSPRSCANCSMTGLPASRTAFRCS